MRASFRGVETLIPIGHWPARTLTTRTQWAAGLALGVVLLLYMFAGLTFGTFDGDNAQAHRVLPANDPLGAQADLPKGPPPVAEPLVLRDMTPQDAFSYNASIPVSSEPNPAARPFLLKTAAEDDRARSLDCLTAAVYYEAAIEPTDGQRAVAQVVLNRLRHPAFPKTVCGVVFQGSERVTGCQFTFTCDGSMARAPSKDGWARARKVAEEALDGKVYKPVGWATHYHTNWVVPYWSATLTKIANVGSHIFYRWEGGWGRAGAFRSAYAGVEPQVALMRNLSSVPFTDGVPTLEAGLMAAVKQLPPGVTPDDFKGRNIIRQYQPLREQSAAARKAELARAEVPQSLRWALTGDAGPAKSTPLGAKPPEPAPLKDAVKAPAAAKTSNGASTAPAGTAGSK
jgi:cell wall hydrolase